MGNEYPATLWAIEIVEAIALMAVIAFMVKLWREVKIPKEEAA